MISGIDAPLTPLARPPIPCMVGAHHAGVNGWGDPGPRRATGHRLAGGSFAAPRGHVHLTREALEAAAAGSGLVAGQPRQPDQGACPCAAGRAHRGLARADAAPARARHRSGGRFRTRATVDTLAALRRAYPALRFVWLMGPQSGRIPPLGSLGRDHATGAGGGLCAAGAAVEGADLACRAAVRSGADQPGQRAGTGAYGAACGLSRHADAARIVQRAAAGCRRGARTCHAKAGRRPGHCHELTGFHHEELM